MASNCGREKEARRNGRGIENYWNWETERITKEREKENYWTWEIERITKEREKENYWTWEIERITKEREKENYWTWEIERIAKDRKIGEIGKRETEENRSKTVKERQDYSVVSISEMFLCRLNEFYLWQKCSWTDDNLQKQTLFLKCIRWWIL